MLIKVITVGVGYKKVDILPALCIRIDDMGRVPVIIENQYFRRRFGCKAAVVQIRYLYFRHGISSFICDD